MANIKKKESGPEHTQSFFAGQVAAGITGNYADATDTMAEGMDVFRQVVEATGGNPVRHGNLFECIEAAKFNVDAALKRSDLNAQVAACPTDPTFPKNPHHPADVVIRDGDEVLRNVQSKAYHDPASAAFELKETKYAGMDRLVPEDKASRIGELLENRAESGSIYAEDYRDASEHLQSELNYQDVSSGGTTYHEAVFAKNHPDLYSSSMKSDQFGEEFVASVGAAGVAGFLIGGGVSAVKNILTAQKGITEVVIDSTKEGVKVGLKGAIIGGGGAVLRFGGYEAGIDTLAKSNVATAIAAGVLNTGVTIYSLAKGEIDAGTAMERFGQTGVSTIYGLFAGSAISVVFAGPAVAVAATIAGYLLANSAYQSCIVILKDAKLAEEKANIVRVICQEAIEEMKKQRELFERQVNQQLELRKSRISTCFDAIDKSLASNKPDKTLNALSDFACLFGKQLRFENQKDFDRFMQQSDSRLKI